MRRKYLVDRNLQRRNAMLAAQQREAEREMSLQAQAQALNA